MPRTAAALVIGNEILTGKIEEANVHALARELRLLGVAFRRVIVCPDEVEVIAADVRRLRAEHDWLFTSGGVGPTPDDVTLPAIAAAFERPLVRSEVIEGLIRGYWGDRVTDGHLRMADVPEGADLVTNDEIAWPVITIENVVVLPGVPEIFRRKLRLLRDRIGADQPFVSRTLLTRCDEGTIAALLQRVSTDFPGVDIGSYPRFRHERYRVKLTFDGLDETTVDAAYAACRAGIPVDELVEPA